MVAAKGLTKPFKMFDAHVVGSSFVTMLSLIAIKRPSTADLLWPGLSSIH